MYSLSKAFFSFISKFDDSSMDPNTLLSGVPDCVWSFNTDFAHNSRKIPNVFICIMTFLQVKLAHMRCLD
ncbi:unnamed protein product [Macrosiphum euphorbiae]|uniref:Uncharacterized protein n=1 Tax=Macrosiphum euphorbiae TaxID=13131 RepID=A0AAV0XPH5_9HEMI|nr:unnamed protein product [Macrosiphum euphorbiae]